MSCSHDFNVLGFWWAWWKARCGLCVQQFAKVHRWGWWFSRGDRESCVLSILTDWCCFCRCLLCEFFSCICISLSFPWLLGITLFMPAVPRTFLLHCRGYMAPEYLIQGIISMKADIFSLGVIIIEIITGRRDYPYFQLDSPESTATSCQHFMEEVCWINPAFAYVPSFYLSGFKCVGTW
jgi:serine/threonine protein kinase